MTTLPPLERELQKAAQRMMEPRSFWMRAKQPARLLTVIAALTFAGGAAAAAGVLGVPGKQGTEITAIPGPSPVTAVDDVQAQLGVLRRPMSDAALPAPLGAAITHDTQAGENPRLGREAMTTDFGMKLYVVPAAHGAVCINLENGSAGCGSADQVNTGTFSMTSMCVRGVEADDVLLTGLLPNGVDRLTLDFNDGSHRDVAVTNNVYATVLARRGALPTTLEWTAGGVTHQAPASPLPPAGIRCAPGR